MVSLPSFGEMGTNRHSVCVSLLVCSTRLYNQGVLLLLGIIHTHASMNMFSMQIRTYHRIGKGSDFCGHLYSVKNDKYNEFNVTYT